MATCTLLTFVFCAFVRLLLARAWNISSTSSISGQLKAFLKNVYFYFQRSVMTLLSKNIFQVLQDTCI
jgi:hypothetical protein